MAILGSMLLSTAASLVGAFMPDYWTYLVLRLFLQIGRLGRPLGPNFLITSWIPLYQSLGAPLHPLPQLPQIFRRANVPCPMHNQMPNRHMDPQLTKACPTKNDRQTNGCVTDRQSYIKGEDRLTEGLTPERQRHRTGGMLNKPTDRRLTFLQTKPNFLLTNKLFYLDGRTRSSLYTRLTLVGI